MLPTCRFVSGRIPGRPIWGRDAEDDLDAIFIDFDAAHENTDDFLHADAIEAIEAMADLGREVLQTTDHERKVALRLNGVKRGPMPLLKLGKALFQTRNARLELGLVDQTLRVAVDQPPAKLRSWAGPTVTVT